MKFGVIIPSCIEHPMRSESWESVRQMSDEATEVIVLFNGCDPPLRLPDGVQSIECENRFADEADLWGYCLRIALDRGWDWCAVIHDDVAFLEDGWEDDLRQSEGWRTPIASWFTYALWGSDGTSGNVTPYRIGATFDPLAWAFQPQVFARERGANVCMLRYGFGYGAWDVMGWCAEQSCAVWQIFKNTKHQWVANQNTRSRLGVGAAGHKDVIQAYQHVLPIEVIDDEHIRIKERTVRIAPEGGLAPSPSWNRRGHVWAYESGKDTQRTWVCFNGRNVDDLRKLHLTEIAAYYGTDKGCFHKGGHGYTEAYHEIFFAIAPDVRSVLELGIFHGASLRMWRSYFPHAQIHGVDYAKELPEEVIRRVAGERVQVHIEDQTDADAMRKIANEAGGFDIVIDDASHDISNFLATFDLIWPFTRRAYVIEDILREWQDQSVGHLRAASQIEPLIIPSRHLERIAIALIRA